ncbi:hypothetical protein BC332_23963 [Capsicum chinense]|nr:hypothetical protein BC332_23963 [Capsicum chinense]
MASNEAILEGKCGGWLVGAVGLRMRVYESTMCFVNCHFAAHLEAVGCRNADFDYVYRSIIFSRSSNFLNAVAGLFPVDGQQNESTLAVVLNCKFLSNTTFTFSNVIGPQEDSTFGGNHISSVKVTSSSLAHAITMHIVSYAGKADMQISVAKDIIPDPKVLAKCFQDDLLEMKEAAKTVAKSYDSGEKKRIMRLLMNDFVL